MKIFILNDTSRGQSGSQQCMKYIYDELKDHEIVGKHTVGEMTLDKSFDIADLVLCNGEGTMHDNVPKANFILETLELAQQNRKKTMLVNTVWQNMKWSNLDQLLTDIDYICVREPASAREIGIKCDIVPDFCMSAYYEITPAVKDVSIKNNRAKGETHPDCHWHGILDYVDACEVKLNKPFREVIEYLNQFNKYITGQHHGVYAAILAGTPFLALPSNTHKIEGLLGWIGKSDPQQFLLDQWKGFNLNEKIPA